MKIFNDHYNSTFKTGMSIQTTRLKATINDPKSLEFTFKSILNIPDKTVLESARCQNKASTRLDLCR